MTLSITILGCSGTYPGPGTACSGYLVRSATTTVWLDCGSGSLANLQHHVGLHDIDAIVCSHSHPDHWAELPLVYNAFRYVLPERREKVPVYWTAQTASLFSVVSGHDTAPTFDAHILVDRATVGIGDLSLRFSRTDHPVETMAVRIEDSDSAIAYSADTGSRWSMAPLSGPIAADGPAGIDVALVEATLAPEDENIVQHLTATQAGTVAAGADVRRLVLTHLAPGRDANAAAAEAATTYAGPISVAEIGTTYSTGEST